MFALEPAESAENALEAAIATSIELPSTAAARLSQTFALTADRHDRNASFPEENFRALQAAGLLGLTVSKSSGGLGGTLTDALKVIGLIAQGESSTALVLSLHYSIHASIVRSKRWPASVRERIERECVRDVSLINALRVEPDLGTPARGGMPATVARRHASGWRISGRKVFSTGAPLLRYGLVWAATDEAQPRVGHFLVPIQATGVRIDPTWQHLGMRASGSHDVIFENVDVPEDHAVDLRQPAEWNKPETIDATWFATTVTAVYDGVARAARDWLVAWAHQRTPGNLGASLATLPRFHEAVGEIDTLLEVNRRLLESIAAQADRAPSSLCTFDGGIIKYTVTGNSIRAVEIALALTGNPGLSQSNRLERHYRDVLCGRVHTPQNDSILIGAGRAAFGV